MTTKAFTLIEVLVSVILLGIISLFISSTIFQTKNNNIIFKKQIQKDLKLETITDILQKDIYQSKEIFVNSQKRYSILYIKTKNSIYGISEPFVIWLVLKENNTLVRLESSKVISLPIQEEFKKNLFVDIATLNCTNFSVNLSKDKNSVLVFLEKNNKNKVLFEVALLQ